MYLDASLKSRGSCDLLWLFGHNFHSHDLQQIPLGYVLKGWLKVINLHILAVVQAAFSVHTTDLISQGSLFCYRFFCHDLQGCLLHGSTKKVTIIPLASPRRHEKQVPFNGAKWGGQHCMLENVISRLRMEVGGQVSPGVGTCHFLA